MMHWILFLKIPKVKSAIIQREMKKKFVYAEPFYDNSAHQRLNVDAKKFLFLSQADWNNVKQQLQSIDRVGVRVSVEN